MLSDIFSRFGKFPQGCDQVILAAWNIFYFFAYTLCVLYHLNFVMMKEIEFSCGYSAVYLVENQEVQPAVAHTNVRSWSETTFRASAYRA